MDCVRPISSPVPGLAFGMVRGEGPRVGPMYIGGAVSTRGMVVGALSSRASGLSGTDCDESHRAAPAPTLPLWFRQDTRGGNQRSPLSNDEREAEARESLASAVPNGDPARLWKAYTIIYTYRPKYTLYETCVVPSWTGLK